MQGESHFTHNLFLNDQFSKATEMNQSQGSVFYHIAEY